MAMRRQAFVVGMVLMLLLSSGCVSQARYRQVTVVIERGGGWPSVTRYVDIAGYPTVLQVMKQAALVETVRTETGGIWITSIDGVSNDRNDVSWSYTIDGITPQLPPSEQTVGPGEVIRWYAR
jgi:hypothetical protein